MYLGVFLGFWCFISYLYIIIVFWLIDRIRFMPYEWTDKRIWIRIWHRSVIISGYIGVEMVWGCVLAGGVELRKRIRRKCLYGFMDTFSDTWRDHGVLSEESVGHKHGWWSWTFFFFEMETICALVKGFCMRFDRLCFIIYQWVRLGLDYYF